MKRSIAFSTALLCGLFLTGCPDPNGRNGRSASNGDRPARVDPAAVAERIREVEARRVEDWASRDVDRIAAHYAAGASVILPCMPRVTGGARIRNRIAAMLRDRDMELHFDPDRLSVAASGDLAYAVGTYTISGIHPGTGLRGLEIGNYLTTYRRQGDGTWKAVDDVAVPGGPADYS